MTCIVGLIDKVQNKIIIGGDSVGIGYYDATPRKDAKVFERGALLFGFTSSFRMGDIIRYNLAMPKVDKEMDAREWLVTDFIPKLREAYRTHGYLTLKDNVEKGGVFLCAFAGRLFRIDDDFQVGESLRDYEAVGCGEGYALGSLYSTDQNTNAMERVEIALKASVEHSSGVRPPFVILSQSF